MHRFRFLGSGFAAVLTAAVVLLPLTPVPTPPASAAAAVHIAGVVTSQPGSAAPTSFTFHRRNGHDATINVSSGTVVLRRYNGHTDIGAVSEGDTLQLWGAFETGGSVFDATRIRDNSIQAADAYGRGKVLSVNATANTMSVHMTAGPLAKWSSITIDVPAGLAIPLPQGGTAAISGVQVGDTIFVRGIYNRTSKTVTAVHSLRILNVVSTPTIQPAGVSVGGFVFKQHHFEVVLVHTVAAAAVQIAIHVAGRTITVSGTANTSGHFQVVRQIDYGRWPSSRHVQTVVTLTSGTAHRTLSRWSWIR